MPGHKVAGSRQEALVEGFPASVEDWGGRRRDHQGFPIFLESPQHMVCSAGTHSWS